MCANVNPFLLPLNSGVTLAQLKWNIWFTWMFGILIAMAVLSAIKTVAMFFCPSLVQNSKLKDLVLRTIKSNTILNNKIIQNISNQLLKHEEKQKPNNIFELKRSFFTFLSYPEDILFFITTLVNIIQLLFIIAWLGWFMYNAQTSVWKYLLTEPLNGTTSISRTIVFMNYFFYTLLGVNGFLTCYNIHLADNFLNTVTTVTSLIGLVLNFALILFSGFQYSIYCNDSLHGYNICNDRCAFCAANYLNANNFCINTFGCSPGFSCIPENFLGWDTDYLFLQIMLLYLVLSYGLTFAASLIYNRRFMKLHKMVKKYEEIRMKKNVGGKLGEYTGDVEDYPKHKTDILIIEYFNQNNFSLEMNKLFKYLYNL